jgi:hypothetical protein
MIIEYSAMRKNSIDAMSALDKNTMSNFGRIGKLFLFFGFLVFLIFLITDQLGQPDYRYLCSGSVILGLGVYLSKKNKSSTAENQRFRIFHRKRKEKENKSEANH